MCLNIQSLIGTAQLNKWIVMLQIHFINLITLKYFQLTTNLKQLSTVHVLSLKHLPWNPLRGLTFALNFHAIVKQSTKVKISLDTICHYFKCYYMIKEIYMYISIFIRLMIGTTEVYMLVPWVPGLEWWSFVPSFFPNISWLRKNSSF